MKVAHRVRAGGHGKRTCTSRHLASGLPVLHVTAAMWEVFSQPGVRLATSFYSDDPVEHMRITGRNTLPRTQANIAEALSRGIRLRAGLVHINTGQRIAPAKELLAGLGVSEIGTDRLRVLGRPQRGAPDITELCGNCGRGSAAVLPDGSLTPCPMSRWMLCGDVRAVGLARALETMRDHAELIAATVQPHALCGPDNDGQCAPCEPSCNPGCDPGVDTSDD
ncbi:radical SAM protein [Streptosporangium sp. CA-115845]|uniref:radical SAM protein n=1 Tax=Streptosporangium sp. CA-115845 TaxID=3240071 RepID=UPI003D91CCF8